MSRLLWTAALTLTLACDRPTSTSTSTSTSTPTPTSTPPPHSPVVFSIVIDQEAAWIADERWPLLPADGGLARLRREGTYAREVRYAHAATDTAPGHAAIYTGAPPRVSGVWGNEILDPATGDRLPIVGDPSVKLVLGSTPSALTGSSNALLKVDTVADRFRAAHPDALIASFSIKDRGALFAGGRKPTVTLWFDKTLDRFVTSTAFTTSFPAWAEPLALPAAVRALPWVLLDPEWTQAHAATPDAQPGEGALGGIPAVFPHDVAHAPAPALAFRGSPFADDALFAFALGVLDAEHAASRPSLVALSLSANDYVGHAFGPDSWEAWDELRRLDASLGRFFAALDAKLGVDGWAAIVTGDHGATTMPEATASPKARPWCSADAASDRWKRACGKVGRIMPDDLGVELRKVAARAVPSATKPLVLGVLDPYVFLTAEGRALAPADLATLKAALTKALLAHPEIAHVYDTSTLPQTCPPESDDGIPALVCRAYVPGGAGELYVVATPGSFFDPNIVVGKGSSHGSPYLFDRTVPIVARAPGRVAAGRVIDEPLSFRTFARTLSTLLGVEPPNPESVRAPDLARPPK